jgi:hypothetical protein
MLSIARRRALGATSLRPFYSTSRVVAVKASEENSNTVSTPPVSSKPADEVLYKLSQRFTIRTMLGVTCINGFVSYLRYSYVVVD